MNQLQKLQNTFNTDFLAGRVCPNDLQSASTKQQKNVKKKKKIINLEHRCINHYNNPQTQRNL